MKDEGFGVYGSRFRDQGVCRIWGLFRAWDLGVGVSGFGCRMKSVGCRVNLRVWSAERRVWGLGCSG